MASISKLTNAFVSIPQELTVAAANFNLDFSLMKIEAPQEYHGLRDSLSAHRRSEAEDGQQHITARKLGALFESLVPPIPNLIRAYGNRVSAISAASAPSQARHRTGIFAAQAGPDGTSIWAAATSGQGALAVQLLACMLARIWKSPEAISLWVELVERRKGCIGGGQPTTFAETAAVMAAKQTFDRKQLAAWDASARSWLQTADRDRRVQQTQLMLIMNNVDIPVNPKRDAYDSVIAAWVSGLTAMEKLVQGIPQRITDGAVLLAMSAWHLYPNLQVLGEQVKDIDQKDELMNGGLVTLSACGSKSGENQGVFWSLPLSKMRYYSPVEVKKRSLTADISRITMEEIWIVVAGIFASQWRASSESTRNLDPGKCCRLIIALSSKVNEPEVSIPWLKYLAGGAQKFRVAAESNSPHHRQLFMMGMRKCKNFLVKRDEQCICMPFFGLSGMNTLLSIGSAKQVEGKIGVLRRFARESEGDPQDLIIRYLNPERPPDSDFFPFCRHWFASVHPFPLSSPRDRGGSESDMTMEDGDKDEDERPTPATKRRRIEEKHCRWIGIEFDESLRCDGSACPGTCEVCSLKIESRLIERMGENCLSIRCADIDRKGEDQFNFLNLENAATAAVYHKLIGDEHAAIFKKKGAYTNFKPRQASIDDVREWLDGDAMDVSRLRAHLSNWANAVENTADTFAHKEEQALHALAFATKLYEGLDGATVSIEVVRKSLYSMRWSEYAWGNGGQRFTLGLQNIIRMTDDLVIPTPEEASRVPRRPRRILDEHLAASLACIAMFETGEYDINPGDLKGIFALSYGESIYVTSQLVCDPAEDTREVPVRRVFGNLGRPEMSFLLLPSKPAMREYDPKSWRMVNHFPWDGKMEDSFGGTSLHLSFTEYEIVVDISEGRGLRDTLAVMIESVVSVNDKGRHLGDLDLAAMHASKELWITQACSHQDQAQACSQTSGGKGCTSHADHAGCLGTLVSIDSWEELLDFPDSPGLVRATGNWQARLAIAAISPQLEKKTLVLPQGACLDCVKEHSRGFHIIVA